MRQDQRLKGIRNCDRGHVMTSQATLVPLWRVRDLVVRLGSSQTPAADRVATRGMIIRLPMTIGRPRPGCEEQRRYQQKRQNFPRESDCRILDRTLDHKSELTRRNKPDSK